MPVPKVGEPAPDFTMHIARSSDTPTTLGRNVSLTDYRDRWLVLLFYPFDFSAGCARELTALSDHADAFAEIGAEILGVSVDSVFAHLAWIKRPYGEDGLGGLNYPLASDITKEVARRYGVLMEDRGIALCGLFLIDPSGVVRYMAINDPHTGQSADETLRVLRILQAGGLCASDWRPSKTPLDK